MDSLYFLIPIAILLTGAAVALYIWAVGNGQYDDLDHEGSRILFEDVEERPSTAGSGLKEGAEGSTFKEGAEGSTFKEDAEGSTFKENAEGSTKDNKNKGG